MFKEGHHESGIDSLFELIVMTALVLLAGLDLGGRHESESKRSAFSGIEQLFLCITLPMFIPFMELGRSSKAKSKEHH